MRDRAVFYSDDVGSARAKDFVRKNPEYTRIDELLISKEFGTDEGRTLFKAINSASGRPWSDREEIWLLLSMRLAQAASGIVHCFGPDRFTRNEPLSNS